jgi:hypothetical protein
MSTPNESGDAPPVRCISSTRTKGLILMSLSVITGPSLRHRTPGDGGGRPVEVVADLRDLCRERGWTRLRLVHELRRVADQELPADESLVRMVRMWVNGTRAPSEMYADLLGKAFDVQLNGYGPESGEQPTKEAVALRQGAGAGCGVDWREGPRNAA